jgi:hypothetical protein
MESEAWKDQVNTRDNAPTESTSVGPNTNTTAFSTSEVAAIEHAAWKDYFHLRESSACTPADSNPNSAISSRPELAVMETDAWTDHIHFREYAPATPTLVDPLGWEEKAKQVERTRHGLLTPSETPRRYEREYSSDEETEVEHEEVDVEVEETEEDAWFHAYTDEQWALVKYGARHRGRDEVKLDDGVDDQRIQELANMIMFCVFLAVLLHGIYVHWDESQKQGAVSASAARYQDTVMLRVLEVKTSRAGDTAWRAEGGWRLVYGGGRAGSRVLSSACLYHLSGWRVAFHRTTRLSSRAVGALNRKTRRVAKSSSPLFTNSHQNNSH